MNRFSFRSECLDDVLKFLSAVGKVTPIIACQMRQDPVFPDFDVEMVVRCDVSVLHSVAKSITDLHVICDSIKPV